MNRIIFLGSGGGRHMVATQMRRTGGLYFEFGFGDLGRSGASSRFQNASHFENENDFAFCLDPGPGALVNAISLGLKPEKWKGVIVSHHHIDHVTDANAVLDAIVYNDEKSRKYPFLIAEEHCLKQGKGKDDPYPYITKYHQELSKKLFAVKAGDLAKVDKLEAKAVRSWHYTHSIGFALNYDSLKIGCPGDGAYYPGQEKHFEGCNVLVLNVPYPKGYEIPKGIHMTLDDAIALVRAIENKPRLVVLSHFFPTILRANMFKQERIFQEATKARCISAADFMELDLDVLKTRILQPVSRSL